MPSLGRAAILSVIFSIVLKEDKDGNGSAG